MIQHVPFAGTNAPSTRDISNMLREEGFGVSAHPIPKSHLGIPQTTTHQSCLALATGQIKIDCSGQNYTLKPGDKLYMAVGTPYIVSTTNEEAAYYFLGRK